MYDYTRFYLNLQLFITVIIFVFCVTNVVPLKGILKTNITV